MHLLDTPTRQAAGLLTLLGLPGVGPQAAKSLARRFSTLGAVRGAPPGELEQLVPAPGRPSLQDVGAWEAAWQDAEATLERAQRHQVQLVPLFEEGYPALLKRLSDAPPLLYVRGALRAGPRHVACVGTRTPSRFGDEVARRVSGYLATAGWSVVSGLALGIDTACHEAALDAKGHTVAVLGNGLDSIYPKQNERLAEAILAAGGALVSEVPPGTAVAGRHLVQRDRLQSGMSAGTVVMQTDVQGGTMHTVRFTLLQGRLLVAPMPAGAHAQDAKSQGLLALLHSTGPELAQLLQAEGEYEVLLRRDFATRAAAMALGGRQDYEKLLHALEVATRERAPVRDAQTQLGLFR